VNCELHTHTHTINILLYRVKTGKGTELRVLSADDVKY